MGWHPIHQPAFVDISYFMRYMKSKLQHSAHTGDQKGGHVFIAATKLASLNSEIL